MAKRDRQTPLGPRWICSAWKVLNNKGNAMRIFNLFFDDTNAPKACHKADVSPYFMYDSLGRLVATVTPNHAWSKAVYRSWDTQHFDANDTYSFPGL